MSRVLRKLRETLGTKPWATWLGILFAIHQSLIFAVLSFSGPKLLALQMSAFTKARYERAINHLGQDPMPFQDPRESRILEREPSSDRPPR